MYLKSVLALLQFTTILPLGRSVDFDEFARRSYLYPLAGYVIGGIALLAVLAIPSAPIAAAVALALTLVLSGFHHFDGLLDFGDGVMAHGSRERRIQALTDRSSGAGGVGLGLVVTLLAFAALQGSPQVGYTILLAEVSAKLAMAALTAVGTPFHEGIQSYLHARARWYFPFIALLLWLPLLLLPLPAPTLAVAAIVTVGGAAGMLLLARRLFGGVNGDVVGAANEIVRMLVILAAALF